MQQQDVIKLIEDAINNKCLSFLKQRIPSMTFDVNAQGEIVVVGEDVGLKRTEQSLSEEASVSSHQRRGKNGEVQRIEQYTRGSKTPTAMELAIMEAKAEESPDVGFDLEAVIQEFMQTLTMPNSLQNQLNIK